MTAFGAESGELWSRWYPTFVKKTSLYLESELDRAVARVAAAEGRSKADVMREAIAVRVSGSTRARITAIGVGHGVGDVADNVDRYLADSDFGTD